MNLKTYKLKGLDMYIVNVESKDIAIVLCLLNKIAVTADIQGKLHISWEEAEKLFDIINIRYLEDDKWKKIEIKSSINEANSVIQ